MTRVAILAGLTLGALSFPAYAQSIHVVDATGAGDFLDLQPAVDAAVDGDLILVRAGNYTGFNVDGKDLTMMADTAGPKPAVLGAVVIQNLAALQSVELHGLAVSVGFGTLLNVNACQGPVLIQDSDFAIPAGSILAVGARIFDCAAVSLVRSTIDTRGQDCEELFSTCGALGVTDSTAFLDEVVIYGSPGYDAGFGGFGDLRPGGLGGPALELRGSTAVVADSVFVAGDGGNATEFLDLSCEDGGNGGFAVRLLIGSDFLTGSTLIDQQSTLTPGQGGAPAGACSGGVAGQPIFFGEGSVETPIDGPRAYWTTPISDSGTNKDFTFTGEPFDFVLQLLSVEHSPIAYFPDLAGPIYPGSPFKLLLHGTLPASGTKNVTIPIVPLGTDFVRFYSQAFFFNATEGWVASNPQVSILRD